MIRELLERTAFLRSLNFLRVRHPYAARYNFIYPSFLGGFITILALFLSKPTDLFSDGGVIEKLLPLLSVIAPFYIAALAAIATFNGPKFIDKPFKMTEPVTLEVIGTLGAWEVIDVTPRHFLSLLFGYCTTISFLLIFLSIFSDSIGPLIKSSLEGAADYFLLLFVFVYGFLSMQLLLFTLLGVYYLADKAHRKDS